MTEKILKYLDKNNNSAILIELEGFIISKFFIEDVEHSLKNDILKIKDKNKEIFISININQIYKTDEKEKELILYLDNDLLLKIMVEDKEMIKL